MKQLLVLALFVVAAYSATEINFNFANLLGGSGGGSGNEVTRECEIASKYVKDYYEIWNDPSRRNTYQSISEIVTEFFASNAVWEDDSGIATGTAAVTSAFLAQNYFNTDAPPAPLTVTEIFCSNTNPRRIVYHWVSGSLHGIDVLDLNRHNKIEYYHPTTVSGTGPYPLANAGRPSCEPAINFLGVYYALWNDPTRRNTTGSIADFDSHYTADAIYQDSTGTYTTSATREAHFATFFTADSAPAQNTVDQIFCSEENPLTFTYHWRVPNFHGFETFVINTANQIVYDLSAEGFSGTGPYDN